MLCKVLRCRIFCLMVSRNIRNRKKQKLTIIAAIIMPVVFSFFITLLQFLPEETMHAETKPTLKTIEYDVWWDSLVDEIHRRRAIIINEQKNFESNVFIPKVSVGYAPNTTAGIRKLVEGAMRRLSLGPAQVYGCIDCEELRIKATKEHFIASFCFHDVTDESQRGLPLNLHFSIIMPSELRYYDDTWIGDSWNVINMYDNQQNDVSNYVLEGFISLQYYISRQYLILASGNAQIPDVLLRSYKLNYIVNNLISESIDASVLVLLLGFMFPVTVITKEIVEDRELSVHFALDKSNVGTRVQFVAWYFNGFWLLFISCMIITLVLKMEWSGHTSMFKKCPWYVIMFFLTSYVFAVVAFSILMGITMRTTKIVVTMVPIYWVLTSLPLLLGQLLSPTLSEIMVIVVSHLLCNVSMSQGLRRILSLEQHVVNLDVDKFLKATLTIDDPALLMFIWCFYIQTLLYLLLATLLEGNICPWLFKLIKCTPCRIPMFKFRRWLNRRQRRKRSVRKVRIELRSKTVEFMRDQAHKIIPTKLQPQPHSESSNETISSTSESTESVQPDLHQSLLDKQMLIWLSNFEFDVGKSIEGDLGLRKSIPKYYMQRPPLDEQQSERSESDGNQSEDEERVGPIVIEFRSVWKKYAKTFAVRNFSLKVHQNEIVVLLGHNAAGKTAILNMATGHTLPYSGKIYIQGYDVAKHPYRAFKQIGVSLQKVNLYTEFTLYEHLIYLSRLRGLSLQESEKDVDLYIRSLQVEDLSESPVLLLTTGQRRLLQALCAFAGRTKIVLLDMPMEGIDMEKQRLFYQLALRERQHRTILITTNSTNVAGKLGDRIGLLINGKLLACDTEKRLLRLNKRVYRLVCFLGIMCSMRKLLQFFEHHIPGMEIESKMGDTAVFVIKHSDLDSLYKLLDLLATKKKDLHLDSYQIITNTLDHILLKAMMHDKHNKSMHEYVTNTLPMLANRIRHIEEMQHLSKKEQFLADSRRLFTHIEVVLRKHFLHDMRDFAMSLLQVFLPSVLCAWILGLLRVQQERQALQPITMTMKCFKNPITLLRIRDTKLDGMRLAAKHFLDYAISNERIIEISSTTRITEFINQHMAEHLLITDLNYVVAASFNDITVTALYNTNLLNAAPVCLVRVMDALAVGFVSPQASISVELEFLPFTTMHTAYLSIDTSRVYGLLCIATSLCLCYVWTLALLSVGLGRKMKYDRLELIGGMRYGTLSIANFIYGMIKIIISLIPINAVYLNFHKSLHLDSFDHFALLYIFVVVGFCIMSINILVSHWLTELRIGYIIIIQIYSIGVVMFLSRNEFAEIHLEGYTWILKFLPYYALVNSMMHINKISNILDICKDKQSYETSVLLENCQRTPNCCENVAADPFFLKLTWPGYVTILLVWVTVYIDLKLSKSKPPTKTDNVINDSDPDSCFNQRVLHFDERKEPDNTWIKEKTRLRILEHQVAKSKALVVENLGVFFPKQVVLNRISFLMERYQALSVVGANGSGKSVLFKTILGVNPHNTGNISSYGLHSYQFKEHGNHKIISHCAQDDTIADALTVTEYMEILLTIRGIRHPNALLEAQTVLKIYDLYSYRYHLLAHCGRGILKRLRIAVSLIGYASLILMDEPFAYLDLRSRLNIYTIIQGKCMQGQAVLYTCSNPKHCDLANRMTLLNEASLCVIGDRHELLLQSLSEYIEVKAQVDIYADRMHSMEAASLRFLRTWDSGEYQNFLDISSTIEHFFPHAIIRGIINRSACFWLSRKTYSMSFVLETLHIHKDIFYSFAIQSPMLESTFQTILEHSISTNQSVHEDEDL